MFLSSRPPDRLQAASQVALPQGLYPGFLCLGSSSGRRRKDYSSHFVPAIWITNSANCRMLNSLPDFRSLWGPTHIGGCSHERHHAIYQIADIAKTARLRAGTKNGNGFSSKGLNNKITDDANIVRVHARSICMAKYAHDLDFELLLAPVVEKQSLCATFTFVIACADAYRIHPSPIVLCLRVNLRVSIHLRRRCLQYPCACTLGESKHVYRTVHTRLGCLHGVSVGKWNPAKRGTQGYKSGQLLNI